LERLAKLVAVMARAYLARIDKHFFLSETRKGNIVEEHMYL
jgi:hypothetical protein